MASKIIFGSDLIDVLENKYNMNKLGEVPTKYKNGITIIDFIYGKEKDIDDLKYNKPYVEFSINDETDRFISGTMYLNGVESVQLDSWEDLKYFVKNAKWTESKKFVRKSLKEGIDVKIVYSDDTPSEYIDDVTHNDILEIIEESPEVYKIFDISGSKKKLVWSNEYGFERAYESKKSVKKSLKESNQITANIWEWQKLLNGVFNFTKWITKTFVNGETLHKSLEKIYRDEEITLDEFVNACIDYIGDSQFEEKINEYVKQYLSTDDKIKNAFKTKGIKVVESKKFTRKSMKESKVDFQSVIDKVIPKEYAKNKNAYKYALSCVESLYNDDEYNSDSAKVYFLNCYISDLFPSWVDELGEEEIDAFANALYDGTMKWSDIDSSWLESKKSARKSMKEGKDSAFYDGIAKEFHFSKDEKNRYKDKTYISAIAVLFDRINNAIKTYGRNSDEEYNALNDCWEVISSAKQNGFNVDYDEDRWNKIAGLPNYR